VATKRQDAKTAAVSSQAVKKRAPKKKKARRPRQPKNLLPPAEVGQQKSQAEEQRKEGGFLGSLGNLFSGESPSQPGPTPLPQKESESRSSTGSSTSERLPDDIERKLEAVPDRISGDGEQTEQAPAGQIEKDDFSALLEMVAFEEQDVRDLLEEAFEWMADKFGSDHWKLSERQSRMLGRPTVMLMNSIWLKLRERLPDVLTRWCESTPGAAAFITACGIVVVPKVMKQVSLSRQTKDEPQQEGETHPDVPSHITASADKKSADGRPWIMQPHG
jgi:hypothetical protein